MSNYKFSYDQLMDMFASLTIGSIKPTILEMGAETYEQFYRWIGGMTRGGIPLVYPDGSLYVEGSKARCVDGMPEGVIRFIGGISCMKLEKDVEDSFEYLKDISGPELRE